MTDTRNQREIKDSLTQWALGQSSQGHQGHVRTKSQAENSYKGIENTKEVDAYLTDRVTRCAAVLLSVAGSIRTFPKLADDLESRALSATVAVPNDFPACRDALVAARALVELVGRARLINEESCAIIVSEFGHCVDEVSELASHRSFASRGHDAESVRVALTPALHYPDMSDSAHSLPAARVDRRHVAMHKRQVDGAEQGTVGGRSVPVPTKSSSSQFAQKDRRARILGLLQHVDSIGIKDVSEEIKDCSEKTIQRGLLTLVSQGVLKKEGERRWSRYRLV